MQEKLIHIQAHIEKFITMNKELTMMNLKAKWGATGPDVNLGQYVDRGDNTTFDKMTNELLGV